MHGPPPLALLLGVGCASEAPTLGRIQGEVFTPCCTFPSGHAAHVGALK